jgi:hypothetical protein
MQRLASHLGQDSAESVPLFRGGRKGEWG